MTNFRLFGMFACRFAFKYIYIYVCVHLYVKLVSFHLIGYCRCGRGMILSLCADEVLEASRVDSEHTYGPKYQI